MIKWEKILKAYIMHVQNSEGTDFLYGSHGYPDGLTDAELKVLLDVHEIVHELIRPFANQSEQ